MLPFSFMWSHIFPLNPLLNFSKLLCCPYYQIILILVAICLTITDFYVWKIFILPPLLSSSVTPLQAPKWHRSIDFFLSDLAGRLLWIYDSKSSTIWAEVCGKGIFSLLFFPFRKLWLVFISCIQALIPHSLNISGCKSPRYSHILKGF